MWVLYYSRVSEHKKRDKAHRMEFVLEKLRHPLLQQMKLKGNGFRVEPLFPLFSSKVEKVMTYSDTTF